jgi:ATP-dependent Lhr-like helicase
VTLSKRAVAALARVREELAETVTADATVVVQSNDSWWWTWAGVRGNATLASALPTVIDPKLGYDNLRLRLRHDLGRGELTAALAAVDPAAVAVPQVTSDAVHGLKFADVLPQHQAVATLSERLVDEPAMRSVAGARVRTVRM